MDKNKKKQKKQKQRQKKKKTCASSLPCDITQQLKEKKVLLQHG